ncbi:MAG: glycosyltransferase family 25 protein [Lonepinella koalarum]|nr:glycosyltransferase family 25 protein [Lonepinella koalarum]
MDKIVISLSNNNENRRNHIVHEFGKVGINFSFFDAVIPDHLENLSKKFNVDISNTRLTKGEIACLFSHLSIYFNMVEYNISKLAIFEDDIYLSKFAKQVLNAIEKTHIPCGIIKLEKSLEYIKTSFLPIESISFDQKYKLYKLRGPHLGSAGYIISNCMARKIIEYYQNKGAKDPIDIVLFQEELTLNSNILQIIPAICIQDFIKNPKNITFKSLLEEERSKKYITSEYKKTRNILLRILKEIIRPFKRTFIFLKKLKYKKVSFYE